LVIKGLFCCFLLYGSLYRLGLCDFTDSFCLIKGVKNFCDVSIIWIVFGVYVYFFLYPADVLLQSATGIAILGLLHSSNYYYYYYYY